jgi:hypothetical protein
LHLLALLAARQPMIKNGLFIKTNRRRTERKRMTHEIAQFNAHFSFFLSFFAIAQSNRHFSFFLFCCCTQFFLCHSRMLMTLNKD